MEKSESQVHWRLLWFKRDLRVVDHEALHHFCEGVDQQTRLLAFYATEPELWWQPDMSWRQAQFIEDSLQELAPALEGLRIPLLLVQGEVVDFLQAFCQQVTADVRLYSHQETGNRWTFQRDLCVKSLSNQLGMAWRESLQHPIKRAGINRDFYDEFASAFWEIPVFLPPEVMPEPVFAKSLEAMAQMSFPMPTILQPLYFQGCIEVGKTLYEQQGQFQRGGRRRGEMCLQRILERGAQNYLQTVAKPDQGAKFSSRLSPHLAWGTLSIREVLQQARLKLTQDRQNRNLRAFLSRLHWQSHFMQKLEAESAIEFQCQHPMYEGLREQQDIEVMQQKLQAWQTGQTGIPFVDACMRSLLMTGWLPFRMRAMLMSFASYQLWLPWQKTAPYLASLFTDYEPGIHYSQVQMQSGVTGINQMRVYNPVKQGLDHDPAAKFITRFCPELASLPKASVHEPWKADEEILLASGFELGRDYPQPIVEHEQAARVAKKKMSEVAQQDQWRDLANAVFRKHGSRLRPSQRQMGTGKRIKAKPKKVKPVNLQAEALRQNQMDLFGEG